MAHLLPVRSLYEPTVSVGVSEHRSEKTPRRFDQRPSLGAIPGTSLPSSGSWPSCSTISRRSAMARIIGPWSGAALTAARIVARVSAHASWEMLSLSPAPIFSAQSAPTDSQTSAASCSHGLGRSVTKASAAAPIRTTAEAPQISRPRFCLRSNTSTSSSPMPLTTLARDSVFPALPKKGGRARETPWRSVGHVREGHVSILSRLGVWASVVGATRAPETARDGRAEA